MIRRTLVLALALIALGTFSAQAAEPVTIDVIISLSGQGTFVGTGQQHAIEIAEDAIDRAGGIAGRPVKFTFEDDQSSPQVALQLLQGAIARKASVVLGPSLAGQCNAMAPAVQASGPLLYCLTAGVDPAPGGYVFATLMPTPQMIDVGAGYFKQRGWKRIAYIVTTDASGQDTERGIVAAAASPQNSGVEIVAREHFAPTDLSVTAQLASIKAANPDAIVAWVTGTAAGTVLRGIQDEGITQPVLLSSGNMTAAFVKQYGSLMNDRMFLSAVAYYGGTTGVDAATRNAMNAVTTAFRAAGAVPDQIGISAWDPTMLIVDALRKVGPDAPASKLRDYLVGLRGWVGVNGVYDFRAAPQRGIGSHAVVVVRWDPTRNDFVPASGLGGKPL